MEEEPISEGHQMIALARVNALSATIANGRGTTTERYQQILISSVQMMPNVVTQNYEILVNVI